MKNILMIMLLGFVGCGGESRDFDSIKSLSSEKGTTYISVGDSTRAVSGYQGQYLFYEVKNALAKKHINSKLMARAGHRLSQFTHDSSYPKTSSVIGAIKGDGENYIVNICLGINDSGYDKDDIVSDLVLAVEKIRKRKPQTNFILTTPNRLYYSDKRTKILRDAYHSAASVLGVPLIDVVDHFRGSVSLDWYRNEDGIHLSRSAQHKVARFVIGKIL